MAKIKVLEVSDSSARVQVEFHTQSGKHKKLTRTIALREATNGTYRGEVILKDAVTGKFIWDYSRFALPVFISNVVMAPNGMPRRYVNSPINEAIVIAMRAIEARVAEEAEASNVA
jgi:hypothetical protein